MVTRKKKKIIILVSIMFLILIIGVTLALLYIKTDLFKSNKTLFEKYIGQNIENIESLYNETEKEQYNEMLQQNKYTTQTQLKVNYTENIGKTSENTENPINQLKLEIDGQTDNSEEYNYQDIYLLNNNEKALEIEYIQSEDIYGIKFPDLFMQYLLVDAENLDELIQTIANTEELENLPDNIEINEGYKEIFQFSETEKEELKTKYMNVINNNLSEENFTKQKNQVIQSGEKSVNANSYTLTLTNEQINNIYIQILEEIKQDEIILTRIDKLQNILEDNQLDGEIDLKEKFTDKIDQLIENINEYDIEQDEIKIIIYESNQTTLKTTIKATNYEINIEMVPNGEESYMQISYQNTEDDDEQNFVYKKMKEESSFTFKNLKDDETKEFSLSISKNINGNNCVNNIVAKYEDDYSRIEATIEQEINIVDYFDDEIDLMEEESIDLTQLDEEQLQAVIDIVSNKISEKINELAGIFEKDEDTENDVELNNENEEEFVSET